MEAHEPIILPLPKQRAAQHERVNLRLEFRRLRCQLHLLRHWWLSPHWAYQPFFVIASARTGSNLLVEYLNQIPGVHCLSEILNWRSPIAPSPRTSSKGAIRHIRRWLQTVRTAHRGCKLFFNHLDDFGLELRDLEIAFPGARYIVLYREALAEQFVSLEAARLTDQWLLLPGEKRKQHPITVDPAALRRFCDVTRRDYQQLLSHPAIYHRGSIFSYEELVENPAQSMQQHVCSFLGVQAIEPQAPLCKQNPEPLAARVTNYSSVGALMASPLCQQHHSLLSQRATRRRAA
jgi:LPS sulfotransferase NodH